MAHDMHAIGPYTKRDWRRRIDGRSSLGRHIRKFQAGLLQHVGGAPNFAVRALIDQLVGLEIQLTLIELKGITTDHDRRCYAAWLNAKRLLLREIGLHAAEPKPPSLGEYLRQKAAAQQLPSPPEGA